MKILVEYTQTELNIQGSRFLAEAFPVQSQEEARELLKTQKQKYADATHVVHAFVIGPTAGVLGCSDDGEPSGTAGRPSLDVLKGSGITNIMITTTRWFGGTLLGTGGLVKAYGDSVKAVLALAQTKEFVIVTDFVFLIGYDFYEKVLKEIKALGATIESEDFAVDITVKGSIAEEKIPQLQTLIQNLTNGRSELRYE